MPSQENSLQLVYRYALIICKNKQNKFLTIQQKSGKWWIPGGKVQQNETFQQAAIRECKQQANIDIRLKGIIRVDYGQYIQKLALRTIYYAEPVEESITNIKKIQDDQSIQAEFMTVEEIYSIKNQWRGREIYDFPKYIIQSNEKYYPFQIFKEGFKFDQKMI